MYYGSVGKKKNDLEPLSIKPQNTCSLFHNLGIFILSHWHSMMCSTKLWTFSPRIAKNLMVSVRNQFSFGTFSYHSSPLPPESNSVPILLLLVECMCRGHFLCNPLEKSQPWRCGNFEGKGGQKWDIDFFPLCSFVWTSLVEGSRAYTAWKAGRRGQKGDGENREIWDLQDRLYLIILTLAP